MSRPKNRMAYLRDIVEAENTLFPDAPYFGESDWRLWTDEEQRQIIELARQIEKRRLGAGPL